MYTVCECSSREVSSYSPAAGNFSGNGRAGGGFICILDILNIEDKPPFPIQVVPEQDQILHL
jgi:hypothetical protein